MEKDVDLLADTPDYEDYSENIVEYLEETLKTGAVDKEVGCGVKKCCKNKVVKQGGCCRNNQGISLMKCCDNKKIKCFGKSDNK